VYDNETVLAALALLTRDGVPVEATFVGGGPLTARYREAAAQRGITSIVRFVGEQPHERLPVLLAEADIYVSASRVDGTSSALLEAMASGLLPVVSRIPANQAWVEDGIGGLLFEPGDAGALAAALRRALDDDELRLGALGVNRRRVETDGSLAANLERLEALLERAVADTAAAG
jgi:glycosyltransferase involved in cell wall biosynthesis